MRDTPKESYVESYLVAQVKRRGGEIRKVRWIGRRNAPDRYVMLGERTAWVELKRPGEEATPAQQRELDRLTEAGELALCINDRDGVTLLLGLMESGLM